MKLVINGKKIETSVDPQITLLKFLRDELNITSVKNGCGKAQCGACTVTVNGKATRSCTTKIKQIEGAMITTVEGLARNGRLHPLQRAFIANSAMQCGFCTPGMIMSAKALVDNNPDPSTEEIKYALTKNRNICRCTGYVPIISAVQSAAAEMRGEPSSMTAGDDPYKFSTSMVSEEAISKVTGKTQYGDDVKLENMIFGKILWAQHPYAEILSIDTTEAEKLPGVKCVITAKDIPGLNQCGIVIRDQPAIADRRVLHSGDTIASVFAETLKIAEQAVKKIQVQYRPLDGIFSPEDAGKESSPQLHTKGNLLHRAEIDRGDVKAAFKKCKVVVENTYTTPFIEHAFLEPESGVAIPGDDGSITIKIGTQCVFDDRTQLSEILNMPEEKIRIIQIPMGGAFGGKEDMILQQHLSLGALKTRHPVKIVLSREESLRSHPKRHPSKIHYKTGADANGKILALEAKIILDTGAYASLGIDVLENTAVFGAGPYYVPNLKIRAESWYTNNVPAGAMRGFGVNQVAVALEQQMDIMRRELNIDPFEFRLINALDVGLPTATDHVLEEGVVAIKETIKAARNSFSNEKLPTLENAKIGVGVASAVKNIGFGHNLPESSGAIAELSSSGGIKVLVSQHEYGQSSVAGLIQLAANTLAIPVKSIQLMGPDTANTPKTGPTTASRQTFMTGNAVVMACSALKKEILHHVANKIECDPLELEFRGGYVIHPKRDTSIGLDELNCKIRVERRYVPPSTHALLENESSHLGKPDFFSRMTHWCYTYTTQVAIVGVCPDTGVVRVIKVLSANDVGKVINLKAVEGQIFGGVVMGLGYALSEEFVVENGIPKTNTFGKCHVPTADQVPVIQPIIVEVPHPFGPEGAKGFAEGPSLATAPAILNAIYDAVKIRIKDLPVNKNRMKEALENQEPV